VYTTRYIHTDYQGSHQVISDAQGNRLEYLAYDPWGRRRNPSDWTYNNVPTSFLFDRGYTGHEHLDKFGLINMNGRVYDPALGRFLSPDPFIQDATNLQNFNRYSYCLNNPLKYTDPSGYRVYPREKNFGNATGDGYNYMSDNINGGYTPARPGYTGPGSMYHWSDQFRNDLGNYFMMSGTTFQNFYGISANDFYENYTAQNSLQVSGAGANPNIFASKYQVESYNNDLNAWVSSENGAYTQLNIFDNNNLAQIVLNSEGGVVASNFITFQENISTGRGGDSWLNTINTVSTWAGAGLVTTEKVLSDTKLGSNIAYRMAYKSVANATKYIKPVGYGTTVLGVGFGLYKYSVSDKSWGDYGQLGVSLLSSGLTLSGMTAPIGIGIGVIDLFHGFDGFYNSLDYNQQTYKTTGGVFLPMNGIPYYFQLRRK
jgi:RHS repeat-associated protein